MHTSALLPLLYFIQPASYPYNNLKKIFFELLEILFNNNAPKLLKNHLLFYVHILVHLPQLLSFSEIFLSFVL